MKGSIAALLSLSMQYARAGGRLLSTSSAHSPQMRRLVGLWVRAGSSRRDSSTQILPSSARARQACVSAAEHNGVLWLEVSVEGKAAHASNPDQGKNAFEGMAELVYHLQTLKRMLRSPARKYSDLSGDSRQPTINVGGVFGGNGQKVNTVPGDAMFTIDRRVMPNEHLCDAEAELRDSIDRAATKASEGLRYEMGATLRIDPCVIDVNDDLPQAFATSVRAVRRRATSYRVTSGFTDLHYFVREGGLPGVGYGVDGRRGHAIDERLKTRDLVQTAKVYAHFMLHGI